jgi:hypothetical protein
VLTVVDFGSTEVFPETSSYIGAIVAQRGVARSRRDHVRVVKVHELPPRFAGVRLFEADSSDVSISNEYLDAYNAPHPAGPVGWSLLSPSARQARIHLEETSEPLDSIAGIYQGIRTGANDIFIVEVESHSGGVFAEVRNGLGDVFLVERSLLRPVVFGSDVRRYKIVQPDKYLIYPYRAGSTISEAELREGFPHIQEYFLYYRSLLAGRKSIAGTGLNWYELVRKRDESWLESKKLLIRDLAIQPAFALDEDGTTFLVGGTAVIPADSSQLLPLMGYLNSIVAEWYLRQITPSFKSGFQKFEPQHLQRLPVPHEIFESDLLGDEISNLVLEILSASRTGDIEMQRQLEKQIDSILLRNLGISVSEIR